MDIGTAFEKFGIPTAILIVTTIGLDKKVWPFIVAQISAWQSDRKAERETTAAGRVHERDAFLSNLSALQQTANAAHLARAERDCIITEQIEAMARAVQQVAVLVQQNYDALHVAAPRGQKRKAAQVQ